MTEFLNSIFTAANIPALITGAVVIVALIIALVVLARHTGRLDSQLKEIADSLTSGMDNVREESRSAAQKDREELGANMRGMGDSVTRVMGEMARTQNDQLTQVTEQIRGIGTTDEARMNEMRKTVEDKLNAYESRMDKIGVILDDKLEKSGARIDKMTTLIDDKLARNEDQLEKIRGTVADNLKALQSDNSARLGEMQAVIDDKLNTTLDRRLGESFRAVSDRLDQVYAGLGEMQSLASGVGDLKRVLTSARARGVVGEIQLGSLISSLMSEEQYECDFRAYPGGEPAPFAIRLPARKKSDRQLMLPIDASFPMDIYAGLLDALDAHDAARAQRVSERIEKALIDTCARIHAGFVRPPRTTDFAILYLPIEGLYAEALRIPGLNERLQKEFHVTLTGPATLAALINSILMGIRSLALETRSEEVWALLGAVKGEFGEFAEALSRTQKRIRQASESIEDTARKTKTLQKRFSHMNLSAEEEARLASEETPAETEDPSDDIWA